jgi:CMP-N-acetylneuraminic acid synthetase
MKAIIPAKYCSKRVPAKNFKNFYKDKSLLDITIDKISSVLESKNIYVSCENLDKKEYIESKKVNFLFNL